MKNTKRQLDGVASVIPATCVSMIPKTIASWVRTPKCPRLKNCPVCHIINKDEPTVPLILEGAISARYIGPTHKPRPDPIPIKNLGIFKDNKADDDGIITYLPTRRRKTELLRPMKAEPNAMRKAHIRWAPRRPHLSMIRLANKLPERPPTVKMEVTREKVTSDIGMQVVCGGGILHVRTA